MYIEMCRALILLLLLQIALASTRFLVPQINTLDPFNVFGFALEPAENQYRLNLRLNKNIREEIVKEIAPGELLVKGLLHQEFGNGVRLNITYEAGRNGYVAKYTYYVVEEIIQVAHISPAALKSGAG